MSDVEEMLKESPPPQETHPGSSPTPEMDAEGKVKKARTTIILREVEPAATEEQIQTLFDNTDLKVVSIRMDVQNTWFVSMETEEQAKQAISHLSNQTLCGKQVKARIKSEGGLRTSAPTWQPPAQSRSAPPMYIHPAAAGTYAAGATYTPQSSPPPGVVVYPNWGGKPASVARPPGAGGFKKVGAAASNTGPASTGASAESSGMQQAVAGTQQQQASGGSQQGHQTRAASQGPRGGKSGQPRTSGGERRSRKPQSSPTVTKPVAFQPQDFPSLGGQAASQDASASVPVSEAPANSWAALAKKAPEPIAPVSAPTQPKKKEQTAPSKPAQAAPSVEKSEGTEKATAPTAQQEKVATPVASPPPLETAESKAEAENKKRGWEKPGLPKKPVSPPVESIAPTQRTSAAAQPSEEKVQPAVAKEGSKESGKDKRQSGRKGKDRDANGHPPLPPVQPPAWGTKSFAQVIKEKPAPVAATSQTATPSAFTGASTAPVLSMLKTNENWGDVEDEENTSSAQTSARTAGATTRAQAPAPAGAAPSGTVKPSSDNSDWRKDAAARRKSEESAARSGSGRRPNGTPS